MKDSDLTDSLIVVNTKAFNYLEEIGTDGESAM